MVMINISFMTEWFAVLIKSLFAKEEAAECLVVSTASKDARYFESDARR